MFDSRISFRYTKQESARGAARHEDRFPGREADGDLGVEPGRDRRARSRPVRRPDRQGQLHRPRLAARHRRAAVAGAAPRARRHAGRDRRARARAVRRRRPHDARRGAGGAAGRGGGRHPRLRFGDPRLRRSGRTLHRAEFCGNVTSARHGAATLQPHSSRPAMRAVPSRATVIRCTRARPARRAACSRSRTRPAIAGRHVAVARLIEKKLPEVTGKPLVMNVSGAIAAVMLDAGFPLLAVKGVPILARTASLIAHLLEEQQRPIGFILAHDRARRHRVRRSLPRRLRARAPDVPARLCAGSASSNRARSSPAPAPA